MSWITVDDVVGILVSALEEGTLRGAVNVVSPHPVRNAEFTQVLAKTLHRPALFPAPAFALRLILGEMADALLLSSQRVVPARLEKAGYRFLHPDSQRRLAPCCRESSFYFTTLMVIVSDRTLPLSGSVASVLCVVCPSRIGSVNSVLN